MGRLFRIYQWNKKIKDENGKETLRLMIGVPVPMQGTAYIFAVADEVENLQCATSYPYEIKGGEIWDIY